MYIISILNTAFCLESGIRGEVTAPHTLPTSPSPGRMVGFGCRMKRDGGGSWVCSAGRTPVGKPTFLNGGEEFPRDAKNLSDFGGGIP